jgi:hypothetical protein
MQLDYRTDNKTGVTETLEYGTDREHRHAPALEVSLDPDALADAIVRASRAARQERQQPSAQPPQPTPTAPVNGASSVLESYEE